jgi:YidC/Oxa1 family membrane protein insertase
VLDPVYYAVSAVMWGWHQIFGLLLGPSSGSGWALSVVFLVLTLRVILIPTVLAQVRSGRAARALAPELAELRRRHAGDAARIVRETAALQKAHGVGAGGVLLPALLQLPVFIGLLHVLRSFTDGAVANYAFGADQVRSFLGARLFGAPLSGYLSMPQLSLEVVLVAVPLLLAAAIATHLTARHSVAQVDPAPPLMRWTQWIFPLGVLAGGLFFPFPIAVLLYWLTQNVWTLAQQYLVHRTEPAPDLGPAPR